MSENPNSPPYCYRAVVLRVVDGDTVHAEIDLGLETCRRVKLRLLGVYAPELREPGGPEARDYLRGLVEGEQVIVRTVKDRTEKYGRYLGVLQLPDGRGVNALLVAAGHATPDPPPPPR